MARGLAMEELDIYFASAPTDELMLHTMQIDKAGSPPIRICQGFEPQTLGVDGQMVEFEDGDISLIPPAKNNRGQQSLNFGFANVNGLVNQYVSESLEQSAPITITYRTYLLSDRTTPKERPRRFLVRGGSLNNGEAVFEASYLDMLNYAWPRQHYNADNATGIKYL